MKKGFTLIELLAVIVILAIIAIIAIPQITNVVENAKEQANLRSLEGHIGDIENNMAMDMLKNTDLSYPDGIYTFADFSFTSFPKKDNVRCDSYKLSKGSVIEATNCIINNKMYCYNNSSASICGSKSGLITKKEGNITWYLNPSSGKLTLTGSGEMNNYTKDNLPEWSKYVSSIKKVEIQNGIDKIGDYAFYGLTSLKEVTFSSKDLKSIGKYSLSNTGIDYILIPDSVVSIGEGALSNNSDIKVIVLSDNLDVVPANLAYNSETLETVIIGKNTKQYLNNAFSKCPNLLKIVVSSNMPYNSNVTLFDEFSNKGIIIYGPDSFNNLVNDLNTKNGSVISFYYPLSEYRPTIWGDGESYLVDFDEIKYEGSTNYKVSALSNADVESATAKYRYKDINGTIYQIEGLVNGKDSNGYYVKNAKMDMIVNAKIGKKDSCTKDNQDILFLGNSITRGFGTHAMASTDVKSDWIYYVMNYMKSLNPNSTYYRQELNTWEGKTNYDDRKVVVDNFITTMNNNRKKQGNQNDVRLIFLEYGDNINSAERRQSFVADSKYLIDTLKKNYPKAEIYYVYGFYSVKQNMDLVKQIVKDNNLKLIDYSEMSGVKRYQSYKGARFIDYSGKLKVLGIDSQGETHPGDYGFVKLANIVIDYLKKDKYCAIKK